MLGIKTYLKRKAPRLWLRVIYWPTRWSARFKKLPPTGPEIFVTLGDTRPNGDIPRHLYSVFNYLAQAGYRIYVYQKLSFRFFDWLKPYGRKIFSIKRLRFVTSMPTKTETMIYLFDHEKVDKELLNRKWKKYVYLSIRKPASWDVGEHVMNMPYVMYPGINKAYDQKNLEMLRRLTRKIRVFFAGNTSRVYYRNPILKKFNQMSRREAIGSLLRKRREIIYLPDKREFYRLVNGREYRNVCVIINFAKFKIHQGRWLETLARSDFFMCFSGTDYPMCHNLIESMAVGTIPILSYPDWMSPPLEHGRNSLIYRSQEELVRCFDEAMGMSAERVAKLRSEVVRYYEEHLSPVSFLKRFEAAPGPLTLGLHRRALDHGPDEKTRAEIKQLNAWLAQTVGKDPCVR